MALLARLCHMEAAFTPRTRAELQGDGTAGGGGVFGCVGECGQSLLTRSGYTYCHWDANGPWESGDGTTCANADSDVPSGQGDGKYGDRLERAFHNAAPATVNRSFSGHVYYQSPNLVPGQGLYGIPKIKWEESYYHTPPCCTGNQARLLPNYVSALARYDYISH